MYPPHQVLSPSRRFGKGAGIESGAAPCPARSIPHCLPRNSAPGRAGGNPMGKKPGHLYRRARLLEELERLFFPSSGKLPGSLVCCSGRMGKPLDFSFLDIEQYGTAAEKTISPLPFLKCWISFMGNGIGWNVSKPVSADLYRLLTTISERLSRKNQYTDRGITPMHQKGIFGKSAETCLV